MSLISRSQIDALIRRKLSKSQKVVREVADIMSKDVKTGETRVSKIEVIDVGEYFFILHIREDGTISFKYSVQRPKIEPNVTFIMRADTFMQVAKGTWTALQAMGWNLIVVKGRDGALDRMYHSSLLAKMFTALHEEGVIG